MLVDLGIAQLVLLPIISRFLLTHLSGLLFLVTFKSLVIIDCGVDFSTQGRDRWQTCYVVRDSLAVQVYLHVLEGPL